MHIGTTVSRTSSENNLTNQMEETPASVVNPTSIKPETSSNSTADPEEGERGSIIHAMDQDACVLRQRRLAFYHNWNSVNNGKIDRCRLTALVILISQYIMQVVRHRRHLTMKFRRLTVRLLSQTLRQLRTRRLIVYWKRI